MFRNGIDPLTQRPVRDRAPNGKLWPAGFRNGNPGNVDYNAKNKWQGQVGLEVLPPGVEDRLARFAVFQSAMWGIRAALRLLISYQDKRGIRTIRGIVSRWAPSNENNTKAYIDAIVAATGFDADQELDLHTYEHAIPVARAKVNHELGRARNFGLTEWYPEDVWDEAGVRAGLRRDVPKPVVRDTEVIAGGAATALAGMTAADGLGVVKEYVEPGSTAAQVIGVLAAALVVYLLVRALRRRRKGM